MIKDGVVRMTTTTTTLRPPPTIHDLATASHHHDHQAVQLHHDDEAEGASDDHHHHHHHDRPFAPVHLDLRGTGRGREVGHATPTTDAVAELPFTGADVRPLVLIGSALIVVGIYILTTLEQRRRTMRRMATSMRTSSAAGYATRTSRWFLGD